jgi:hypothetical protein
VVADVAGVALGAVLLVAGIAKRIDRAWPVEASAFGVPRWAARLLPYVEVALGALLVAGVRQPFVAGVAAILLIGFTVKLVMLLLHGRRPPCACFGARSARPIGWWSIVRNLLLLALAGAAMTA